jgi:hypothetical protein
MTTEIVLCGTYDLGKPRVRILIQGLIDNGAEVTPIHGDVWSGVEDKSQLHGFKNIMQRAFRWISKYPGLIYRFLKVPKCRTVLVPYMGHFDVLILWPFARIRGSRIIWDAFLSLYNTIIEDRQLVTSKHPVAWLIYAVEWLATRATDSIVLDTCSHADYFASRYKVSSEKLFSGG